VADLLDRLRAALASRYLVERELGRGGMATVYLARDIKHERSVAIKLLRPELASHGYRPERFLREIRTVAGLTHPNILPLHDSDDREGLLFYVMPYMVEGTLRDRLLRETRLPIMEAVRVARAIASALDYAHRHGVLHRDVKPENIFLQEGQPLVADFGVALALSACCDDLTEAGFAVGTPAYMSPEQASGDDAVDGRSDLYALACVMYEMVTGRPPFDGGNVRKTLALHATAPVPRVRPLRPEAPAALEDVLVRALAKNPEDRFTTSAAFGDALEHALSLPTPDRRGLGEGGQGRAIAVLPFVNASQDPDAEYLSDGITDELIYALGKVDGLRVISRTSVFALKGEHRDIRATGALLNVAAVLEGTVRTAGRRLRITAQLTDVLNGRLLWSERYDREMEDVFAIQDEIARTIVSTLRHTLLGDIGEPSRPRYTESVTAYSLYLRGRYHWNRRSKEGIAEAIKHFEAAIAEDPGFALAYSGLADAYALHIDYRGLTVAGGMDRAKAEARKALELDESLAEAHTSLGWVTFIYDWDWEAAAREFIRALTLNPAYATAHQWYAWLLAAMGRLEEALAQTRTAVELDPISVPIRRGLGWLYYYARQPDPAVMHLRRAIAMDPTSTENHRLLALAQMQRSSQEDAMRAVREALVLAPQSAYCLGTLGYLEGVRGRTDRTRQALGQLQALAGERYVSPVAFVMAHVGLGDVDGAFHWLAEAYEERRGWLAYLNVEPVFDLLRSDERFPALLRKVGLE
jgi:serine/threonine-protein kinase